MAPEAATYSGIDDPARWVLVDALQEQALRRPAATWFEGLDEETLSFGQAWSDACCVAGFLATLGVKAGERVALMAGNHADFVRAWMGLSRLGAVVVLLNPELHGGLLAHPVRNSGVRWVIADADVLPALAAVAGDAPALAGFVLIGEVTSGTSGLQNVRFDGWRHAAEYDGSGPQATDLACVMYTSGTTGPSKGVLMPHAHCTLYGIGALESVQVRGDDRWYVTMPLHHVNGLLMQLGAALLAGIPALVRPRFSAGAWLDDIRRHRATITNTLGVMAAFILQQPPRPDDRDHLLRVVNNGPNLVEHDRAFRERFGVADVLSGYGMTEVNIPVWGRVGEALPGACGRVSRWFELIVADPATDRPLPPGQVGEVLVRPRLPFCFMQGYLDMPAKTVEAWRNLWFHTGDAGLLDAQGVFTFVGRLGDNIRRRGENISAQDVEALLANLPGVAEVAACAVPSGIPGGEDEVLLAIVATPGERGPAMHLAEIGRAAEALLPSFARPRFIRMLPALPKTATGKVQHAVLRQLGAEGAFDRDAPPASPRNLGALR